MDATTFAEIRSFIEYSRCRLIDAEYRGRGVRADRKIHFTPGGRKPSLDTTLIQEPSVLKHVPLITWTCSWRKGNHMGIRRIKWNFHKVIKNKMVLYNRW